MAIQPSCFETCGHPCPLEALAPSPEQSVPPITQTEVEQLRRNQTALIRLAEVTILVQRYLKSPGAHYETLDRELQVSNPLLQALAGCAFNVAYGLCRTRRPVTDEKGDAHVWPRLRAIN